jgi:hypothetical protein
MCTLVGNRKLIGKVPNGYCDSPTLSYRFFRISETTLTLANNVGETHV